MKKFLAMLLLFSMLLSTTAFATMEAYYGEYILSAGARATTEAYVKSQSANVMKVWPVTQTSGVTVWYRGRQQDASHSATVAKSYTSMPSNIQLTYLDGCGYVGNSYRLRVQNDRTSNRDLTAYGTWRP